MSYIARIKIKIQQKVITDSYILFSVQDSISLDYFSVVSGCISSRREAQTSNSIGNIKFDNGPKFVMLLASSPWFLPAASQFCESGSLPWLI